ncbi:MoaD/ThiS family protein [Chitinophagaceae bacterium LWZ2-11]
MPVRTLVFGQLTDILAPVLERPESSSVGEFKALLEQDYPTLATYTYCIAVNKRVAEEGDIITPNAEVALLPPFSGG